MSGASVSNLVISTPFTAHSILGCRMLVRILSDHTRHCRRNALIQLNIHKAAKPTTSLVEETSDHVSGLQFAMLSAGRRTENTVSEIERGAETHELQTVTRRSNERDAGLSSTRNGTYVYTPTRTL